MVSVRSGNTSSNIVQATNSMAEHYAELAEGYKNDAATYAQGSLLQAALAQQWATKTNGTVDGTDYSAKYYAQSISNALSGYTPTASLAAVALSGAYSDLIGIPTIPTVNNATLTIQKNGTDVQTFTANASSNVTCNITVPTNTNELTNGAGFITSSAISNMQTTTNLVTSVSSSSTNSQYPSAKLFYDTIGNIESTINTIRGI